MSMREKSLERRRVTKEHNSNFRAGHVFVNENQLYKTGLRGRKRFVFYLILLVLYIVVLTNLLVLLLIVFSLKINHEGMSLMEVVPGRATRFLKEMCMNTLIFNGSTSGQLGSFQSQNLNFFGKKIDLQSPNSQRSNAHIRIGLKKTEIFSDSFEVINPSTNKTIFPQQNFQLPIYLNKVSFGLLNTSRISSATGQNLQLTSDVFGKISAGEDIYLRSNQMLWNSSSSLRFSAKNINLKSEGGLFMTGLAENGNVGQNYKLCISADSWRIFTKPHNTNCAN